MDNHKVIEKLSPTGHSMSNTILHMWGRGFLTETLTSSARLHGRRWYSLWYPTDLLKQHRTSQCFPSPILTVSLIWGTASRENQLVAHAFEWQQGWRRFWEKGIGVFTGNYQWRKYKSYQMDFYLGSNRLQGSLPCAHSHFYSSLGSTSSCARREKLILRWWDDLVQ